MLMCLGGAGALAYAIPPRPSAPTLVELFSYDACAIQVKGLGEISPGGFCCRQHSGLPCSINCHPVLPLERLHSTVVDRAEPVLRCFPPTDAEKRRGAAAPFTYLALCSPPQVLQFPANSLLAELQRGHEWPGCCQFW